MPSGKPGKSSIFSMLIRCPPGIFDSRISVESPCRAAKRPAVRPARPEPTTMTSYADIRRFNVQNVQAVQPLRSVQSPTSFLPRDAGEDVRSGFERFELFERLERAYKLPPFIY